MSLNDAFITFAPEPRYLECRCCELVFDVRQMTEDFDGYLCGDCHHEVSELEEILEVANAH